MKATAVLPLAALLALPAGAVSLTSVDGRIKEFPVVIRAARDGLTVRESAAGRDIVVPWTRLDLSSSASANPWLPDAHAKAAAGETILLNIGLPDLPDPRPVASNTTGDYTILKSTAKGASDDNFTSLALTAYVHRDVKKPRMAVVWVGDTSPLASRSDAADMARRMAGALVLATFSGNYLDAARGSGDALVREITALFAEKNGTKTKAAATPAIVILGQGEAASFAWSLVCARAPDVLAAVTIDGRHTTPPNAGVFATPVLFVQTTGPADPALTTAENLERPFDLWRHYSTDGSRWCFAKVTPTLDPLTVAVAFCRETAGLSPYQEVVALWEDYQNDQLKHRIPIPTRSFKELKETGALLGTLRATQTFPVKSRTGSARNDLIWLPNDAFAKVLRAN
jgi:hypothetical protein